MSQERRARVRAAILFRVSGALLLATALVCTWARPATGKAGGSIFAFEAGGAIYLMEADGTTTQIVDNNAGVNMQPALSPDGSRVAFSSKRDGKFSIYIVNLDGGGLRRLTNGPGDDSEPAWSPDGTRIAFVRGFDPTGSGVIVLACALPGNIIVVGVDQSFNGGRPVEVNLTNGMGGTDPAWSPDGTRIAFAGDLGGNENYDIYTMSSVDGSGVQRLTEDETQEGDPAWSPDGNWIAYTSGLRVIRGSECGNMPIAGTPTGGTCTDANGNGTCDEDEDDIFMSDSGPYVCRMTAAGGQQKRLTVEGGAAEPDWSPDGSQVVFVGGAKGESAQLYLVATDGTGQWFQLTFDPPEALSPPGEKSSPSWSGTSIR